MTDPLALALVALVAVLFLALVWEATSRSKNPAVRRLRELEAQRSAGREETIVRRTARSRLTGWLQGVGSRVRGEDEEGQAVGLVRTLELAGYRSPGAPAVYHGLRILAAVALLVLPFLVALLFGVRPAYGALAGVYGSIMGLILPRFVLKKRVSLRQKQLRKALPDTLDLLVVCVEAGLGLNQALLKVAEDCRKFSPEMSQELRVLNLEIRAGTPRATALRNLGRRTDVEDVRSLAAMLIQADRFGTSIGQALRVHSGSLRKKRSQRAEEAAAKTTIKLVFPLVLFVFPALFVVILGPVMIRVMDQMSGMG